MGRSPTYCLTLASSGQRGFGPGVRPIEKGLYRDYALLIADVMFVLQRARIVELAAKHRLPAMYTAAAFAQAGGLLEYTPDLVHLFRRIARHVDKILRGANPADLPVEQPMKFEFTVNLKTARALAIIPAWILW